MMAFSSVHYLWCWLVITSVGFQQKNIWISWWQLKLV